MDRFIMRTVRIFLGLLVSGICLPGLLANGAEKASGADATDAAVGVELEVMSFNVRYGLADDGANSWVHREPLIKEVIREGSPDLIGLQEALRFQMDAILGAFPEYGEIGLGREGGKEGEYTAILYRKERFTVEDSGTFWLSDTPAVPSSHWGNRYIRICTYARLMDTATGTAFYYYNTHLDNVSQVAREKGVRLIASVMAQRVSPDPVILSGDFNAGEENPAILYLKGEGEGEPESPIVLVDTYREVHPDEEIVGTFNGFKGEETGPKIDYIFVGPGVSTRAAAIVKLTQDGVYPSDHYPVTARLVIERRMR